MISPVEESIEQAVQTAQTRGGRAETVSLAFAPVHKRALGVAVAAIFGLAIFGVTVFHVVLRPANAFNIGLLAQYFYGFEVSWRGAFVGFFWGFVTGFVLGWFAAFVHNFAVAVKVFTFRTKAVLAQTKDFLDRI